MKERRKEGLRSRQERIANEVLMYFRSQKKLQGEVSLSDSIETDKEGNALQLMDVVGVDDTKFDGAMAVIEKTCKSRKQIATSPSPVGGATGVHMPYPIEVMVGGATIFVLSVDQFIKL